MDSFIQYTLEHFWQSAAAIIGIMAGLLAIADAFKTKFGGGGVRKSLYIVCGIAFLVSTMYLKEQYDLYRREQEVVEQDGGNTIGNGGDSAGNGGGTVQNVSGEGVVFAGSGNTVIINNSEDDAQKADTPEPVTITEVVLNKTSLDMRSNEEETLSAVVLYSDNSRDHKVCWISSDETVAKVEEDGTVTALAPGTAEITAQASRNNRAQSAVCLITVRDAPTGYAISLSTDKVCLGEIFYVYVEPYNDDVEEIEICAEAPSGEIFKRPMEDGAFFVYTETGKWKIYASLKNEAGVYEAAREEDFVTLEVINILEGTSGF